MRQLAVSDRITEETKEVVGDAFEEVNDMMRECAAGGVMSHQPPSFRVGDYECDRRYDDGFHRA
jgi:hypothetical protein